MARNMFASSSLYFGILCSPTVYSSSSSLTSLYRFRRAKSFNILSGYPKVKSFHNVPEKSGQRGPNTVSQPDPTRPIFGASSDQSPRDPNITNGQKTAEDRTISTFRKFFRHRAVREGFKSLKDTSQLLVKQDLEKISAGAELSVESGYEAAALIDLLKLFEASDPGLEEAGRRAREGALLMEEGQKLVKEGESIMDSALEDIHKHFY